MINEVLCTRSDCELNMRFLDKKQANSSWDVWGNKMSVIKNEPLKRFCDHLSVILSLYKEEDIRRIPSVDLL